jgi:hypothetical protein
LTKQVIWIIITILDPWIKYHIGVVRISGIGHLELFLYLDLPPWISSADAVTAEICAGIIGAGRAMTGHHRHRI